MKSTIAFLAASVAVGCHQQNSGDSVDLSPTNSSASAANRMAVEAANMPPTNNISNADTNMSAYPNDSDR